MTEFAQCPTLNSRIIHWNNEISNLADDFGKLNINDAPIPKKMDAKVARVNQIIRELPNVQIPVLNKTRRRNKSKTPEPPPKEKTPEPPKEKTPEQQKLDKDKTELRYLLNNLNKNIISENKNEITNLSKQIQEKFDNLLQDRRFYICPSPYSKKRHNSETYKDTMGKKVVKKGGKTKHNRRKNKTKNRK